MLVDRLFDGAVLMLPTTYVAVEREKKDGKKEKNEERNGGLLNEEKLDERIDGEKKSGKKGGGRMGGEEGVGMREKGVRAASQQGVPDSCLVSVFSFCSACSGTRFSPGLKDKEFIKHMRFE